jgi:hypothetical protein
MGLIKFLGLSKPEKLIIDSEDCERTSEEFENKILRLKPVIEGNEKICNNIVSTFEHIYLGNELSSESTHLDKGSAHSLFNVGMVEDPLNGREVHLATRLSYNLDYFYHDSEFSLCYFTSQLNQYKDAFLDGDNLPYLTAAVTWKDLVGENHYAFLVEDVTHNQKYTLTTKDLPKRRNGMGLLTTLNCNIYERRVEDDKTFFLDPKFTDSNAGGKYIQDKFLININ